VARRSARSRLERPAGCPMCPLTSAPMGPSRSPARLCPIESRERRSNGPRTDRLRFRYEEGDQEHRPGDGPPDGRHDESRMDHVEEGKSHKASGCGISFPRRRMGPGNCFRKNEVGTDRRARHTTERSWAHRPFPRDGEDVCPPQHGPFRCSVSSPGRLAHRPE